MVDHTWAATSVSVWRFAATGRGHTSAHQITREADPLKTMQLADQRARATMPSANPEPGATTRSLGPRRSLPGGRAVVGGLLVTVALLGTWWTSTAASKPPRTSFLVAAHDLSPGHRLERSDLALVVTDLPASLRRRAFTDPSSLVGNVALAPIAGGELVQSAAVGDGKGGVPARDLSFVVDADWALGGTLRPGDRIDLLATFGQGENSTTRPILSNLVLRRVVDSGTGGLGSTRRQTLTVAIARTSAVEAAVNAARAGTITIVRSTAASTTASAATSPSTSTGDAGPRSGDTPGPRRKGR